jgi:hypothetical protein
LSFLTASRAFSLLDLTKHWDLELWFLDDSPFPVAQLEPSRVRVIRDGASSSTLWPPPVKAKRPAFGKPAKAIADGVVVGPELLLAIADAFDEDAAAPDDDAVGPPVEEDPLLAVLLDEALEVLDDVDAAPHVVGGALATMIVPGGVIKYYPSKGDFEAVCNSAGHPTATARCVITRQCSSYKIGERIFRKGGRPIGLMIAWLARGCTCIDRQNHRDVLAEIDFKERYDARMSALAFHGYAALVACEREDWDDEELPFEPLDV